MSGKRREERIQIYTDKKIYMYSIETKICIHNITNVNIQATLLKANKIFKKRI